MSGLFIQNHQKHDKYVQNSSTSNNPFGVSGYNYGGFNFGDLAVFGLTQGASLFFQYWGEGSGADDENEKDVDEATQAKIDEKNKELEQVYADANGVAKGLGISDYDSLKGAVKTADNKLSGLTKEYNSLSKEIGSVQSKLEKLSNLDDNKKTADYEQKVLKYQQQLEKLQKDAENKKKEVETAQDVLIQLNSYLGKAQNIKAEIKSLYGEKTGVKYDVEQETSDIKEFMSKLQTFNANPTKEHAVALKEAFEGGSDSSNKDSGIQQKTIVKAYALVKDRVEKLANED